MSEPNTTCEGCGERFYKKPKEKARTSNHYCSKECYYESVTKKPNTICEECGERIYKPPSHIERASKHYCDKKCYSKSQIVNSVPHDLEGQQGYEMWSGNEIFVSVHQLLAISEGADPYKVFGRNGWNVHHKNGCKIDNRLENIEVVTVKENGADGSTRKVEKYTHNDMLEAAKRVHESTDLSIEETIEITLGEE